MFLHTSLLVFTKVTLYSCNSFPGHLVDTSPALSPDRAEPKKSLEMPRLSETSIKDRLAKYQAAVSKQGSSTGLATTVSLLSFGLCRSEFLPQPEAGKKILGQLGHLKIMPSCFEKTSVLVGFISDEDPLQTAGRNKYLHLAAMIMKVFKGINCWYPD